MSDKQDSDGLRRRLASAEKRVGELRLREEQSRENIPRRGFKRASDRSKLLSEIEEADDSLRADKERLAQLEETLTTDSV